jgi:hypothetical protein
MDPSILNPQEQNVHDQQSSNPTLDNQLPVEAQQTTPMTAADTSASESAADLNTGNSNPSTSWEWQQPVMEPDSDTNQQVTYYQQHGSPPTVSEPTRGATLHETQPHVVEEEPQSLRESVAPESEGSDLSTTRSERLSTGDASQEVPHPAYPLLPYSTGLDVDSNPTETDGSDADSAIGPSVFSSTMSTNSSVYEFVEENGRTYHRFKEGKYYLPNDEVIISMLSCKEHSY